MLTLCDYVIIYDLYRLQEEYQSYHPTDDSTQSEEEEEEEEKPKAV